MTVYQSSICRAGNSLQTTMNMESFLTDIVRPCASGPARARTEAVCAPAGTDVDAGRSRDIPEAIGMASVPHPQFGGAQRARQMGSDTGAAPHGSAHSNVPSVPRPFERNRRR